jgi:hypothetical protein
MTAGNTLSDFFLGFILRLGVFKPQPTGSWFYFRIPMKVGWNLDLLAFLVEHA